MKIGIPKKLDCKLIIKCMLYFVCFERLLESVGIPHTVIFLLDVANLVLLINLLTSKRILSEVWNPIIILQILVIVVGAAVALLNSVKLILIIWALRNLCRFWIFFIACKHYLKKEDADGIFKSFKRIYFINFAFILVQYVMGFRGDYLGGIFGLATGANAYCNVFFLIVCTYEIVSWFEKRTSTFKMLGFISIAVAISAVAEIKIFFVEIVLIFLMAFFLVCAIERRTKVFVKAIGIAAVGAISLFLGIRVMISMYPNFSNFFTIEGFLYHTTRESGYTGFGDLNRLTAIKSINNILFIDSKLQRIFGMGIGSTEYSSINFITSLFYKQYTYLHYFWFSHAWMYLECGYLGLILYITGFIFNGISGVKRIKKYKNDSLILMTGIILSFMTLILYLYNQSLRIESAYLLYFCFAVMRFGGDNNVGKEIPRRNRN